MNINGAIDTLFAQVTGAQAAALMGYDGLAVACRTQEGLSFNLQALLTEYVQTLVVLRRAHDEVPQAGRPQEVVVHTDRLTVLLIAVSQAHYLAVVQPVGAPVGRAQFYMRALFQRLADEL